ncbi:MAG: D-alanyl-D-alanine carboxypeptidase [Spirochaetes bacterium]|nr:D-alanyl-D-alanine carboxypeptidase [Spirochaetota bacterium]
MRVAAAMRAALTVLLFFVLTSLGARDLPRLPEWIANSDIPQPPVSAQAAILIDHETGTVLYEKTADTVIPPASLTKIMTIHLVLELARDGVISLGETFEVPRAAWARNMPPGSSLMFLGPGQRVSYAELLEGLVVASGNDAAVAVSLEVAGSVPAFVEMMNIEAQRLGYEVMHFSDPAGLSPRNRITAREYADFVRRHLIRWPDSLDDFYSKRRIIYPTESNFDSVMIGGSVRQENRNTLLFEYAGVDGLKTGYIDASGYNLAVTAERDGRRLIAVVLGVRAASVAEGARLRAVDAAALLDYGFDKFRRLEPTVPQQPSLRVWKGKDNEVPVVAGAAPSAVLVPRGRAESVTVSVNTTSEITAPVETGRPVGTVSYRLGDDELARVELLTGAGVDRAGFFKRLWHAVMLFAQRLLS